mmetsp:Transcript_10122/g.24514  ORF Transcript_10122/g.24514 Transcript_10122/m.24514 type:complete len:219 (-) Transcript_10122:249-905(-)
MRNRHLHARPREHLFDLLKGQPACLVAVIVPHRVDNLLPRVCAVVDPPPYPRLQIIHHPLQYPRPVVRPGVHGRHHLLPHVLRRPRPDETSARPWLRYRRLLQAPGHWPDGHQHPPVLLLLVHGRRLEPLGELGHLARGHKGLAHLQEVVVGQGPLPAVVEAVALALLMDGREVAGHHVLSDRLGGRRAHKVVDKGVLHCLCHNCSATVIPLLLPPMP